MTFLGEYVILLVSLVFIFTVSRAFIMLNEFRRNRTVPSMLTLKRTATVKVMIVAGSGGHTTEMLKLVSVLSPDKYSPRHYVVADTDTLSAEKIRMLEVHRATDSPYEMSKIRRSREVHQSWSSTFITTFIASIYSVVLVFKSRPDLILCNGPGTCVPLCFAAFLSSVTGWKRVKIVFVESFCRAKSLSLTGRFLYHISDEFLVQWPLLAERYPRVRYIGRLV